MTLLPLIALFAAIFISSAILSYALFSLKPGSRTGFEPTPNSPVRLRGPSGVYRCRFLAADRDGWWFSSPLARDHYVPLRVGERLFVEAPAARGAILFETEITAREAESHRIKLKRPSSLRVFERRIDVRDRKLAGRIFTVNGESAEVVDISKGGMCFLTQQDFAKGDEVRIEMPEDLKRVAGWVLEVEPAAIGDRQGSSVRVRFG